MVRTRKRCYGEEVSQCSSNIAYLDRSRPKQFDQQEGKRQKKSKESRFFTFDMCHRDFESLRLVSNHNKIFQKLLEEVCNGQDRTLGNAKDDNFWRNFTDKFCRKSGLENKEGMHITCQHYCDDLKLGYNYMKKTLSPYPVDGPSPEHWYQLTRIFGGRSPSTSTGRSSRSSQSRGSTSSIRSGHVKKLEIRNALAELSHSGDLDFDEIEDFGKYVCQCKTGLHTFMGGTKEYRVSVVRKYRKSVFRKHMGKDYQETEIEETQMVDTMQ